jgi:hypothetical protein
MKRSESRRLSAREAAKPQENDEVSEIAQRVQISNHHFDRVTPMPPGCSVLSDSCSNQPSQADNTND